MNREQRQTTQPIDNPANQFEFVLNDVSRRMRRVYNQLFRDAGVSAPQAGALVFLSRYGQQTQNELAGRLELGKAATAALLSRMEKAGLVVRVVGANDRREREIHLTQKAMRIVAKIDHLAVGLGLRLREGTTAEERHNAAQVMIRMKQNLQVLESERRDGRSVE